jgi:hypothetical protein
VPTHRRCPRSFESDAARQATTSRKFGKIAQIVAEKVVQDAFWTVVRKAGRLRISKSTLYLKIGSTG